jgi:hypothetical protein
MAGNVKDYEGRTDTKYILKDCGTRIDPKRCEAFIERVFAAEHRPARVVSVGDALIEGAFDHE